MRLDLLEIVGVGDRGEAVLARAWQRAAGRLPRLALRELGPRLRERPQRQRDPSLGVEHREIALAAEDREQQRDVAFRTARAQRELALPVQQLDVAHARAAQVRAQVLREARCTAAVAARRLAQRTDARALGIAREREPAPPPSRWASLASAEQLEHHARRVGLHHLLDPVAGDLAAQDRRGALELSQAQHRASAAKRRAQRAEGERSRKGGLRLCDGCTVESWAIP